MWNTFFKKADFVLLALLILLGTAGSLLLADAEDAGDTVLIKQNGEVYGRYALTEEQDLRVADGLHYNIVHIHGGEVSVTEANCPNHVCVEHTPIHRSGECIVCLPHKLVVEIESEGGDAYDTVAR